MIIHCLYDELVQRQKLKPHPKNRNEHPPEQVARLAQILRFQGWRYPVKVSKRSGFVTSGHGRMEAAWLNGWDSVPVNYQDYESEEQEYADVISDNAIASWAELDLAGINQDFIELGPDFDIDMLGIKDFVLEPADKGGLTDEDSIPETPAIPHTKLGDLFLLGEHRLICGDSTYRAQVDRLMNGQKADMFLTDPPYGVSYMAKNAAVHGGIVKNQTGKQITSDEMSLEDCTKLWRSAAECAYEATSDEASYYWFACQGGDQMMMMMMSISDANWKVRHELIWVKPSLVFGRSDYHYRHEPILYGWKKDGTHHFYGDRKQTSVLEFDRPHKSDFHPTTKPIELLEYLLKNNSQSGQSVLDLFLGSGSTLIACEKTNRKCYGSEIDPHYCDVILDRWAKYTGRDPIREDGKPWSVVKSELEE